MTNRWDMKMICIVESNINSICNGDILLCIGQIKNMQSHYVIVKNGNIFIIDEEEIKFKILTDKEI